MVGSFGREGGLDCVSNLGGGFRGGVGLGGW